MPPLPASPRPGRPLSAETRLDVGRRVCHDITYANGTTYYWGTLFLDREQREDVYAVYALCRLADDIVDEPGAAHLAGLGVPGAEVGPEDRLDAFEARFREAWERGEDDVPVFHAIVTSVRRMQLPQDCFDRFFHAMRLDLTRTSWATWPELRDDYMEGSAAVVGEMMLPVLRPHSPGALGPARALGLAFQLTNFLRDVGEDLDRGRVYLPADELAAHGADPWVRRVTPEWRRFLAAQIDRNRELYRQAEPGVAMLPPASARCVGAALSMYADILTRIEKADYDVFTQRRRVSPAGKVALTARTLLTGRPHLSGPATSPSSATSTPDAPVDGAAPVHRDRIPIKRVPQPPAEELRSTWRQAAIPRIEKALARALDRDPGGWYVVGCSGDVGAESIVRTIAGREIALWRTEDGELRASSGVCPHMGARLDRCEVDGRDLMCRWHGLRLPSEWPPAASGRWPTFPVHDDGVLLWVQLPTEGETPCEAPRLPVRPALDTAISAVHVAAAQCAPEDVVANRLDPWHGAWLHPYAFSHLVVDDDASTPDRLVTDVAFRLTPTWGVPVRAEFTCPDARTIVMHITEGEGRGSVVETHATPLTAPGADRPVSVMTEATIASSDRMGFRVARAFSPLITPFVRRTQAQLWVDDLEYAERRRLVRRGVVTP
ncbi:DUF5914 domain-containing protein [Mobilicoccus pelagius]|uniref:Phytoene synthase n=1 Tax=Mobilicoccus pelagius NBRC 104925 TaxID=1089455 RepID=H5UVM2_9MICO|nr:DUF5914 domain-containing protein [Mobilicoccus pelagius]GAB49780.1 phytoene synthase [Mobilicoccus pelagius NBRC 104925]